MILKRLLPGNPLTKKQSHRIAPDERGLMSSTRKTLGNGRSEQGPHCANAETCAQRPIIALMFVSASFFAGKYAKHAPAV
jgi:hypothetical protein